MQRNVTIFGLIIGIILCINLFYIVHLCYNQPDFESNDVVGYAAMIVIFSLVFFGIRNYRNQHLNGIISLGEAFKTGALIAIIGSTVYVLVWMFYYHFFVPDFLDKYIAHVLKEATREGSTTIELAEISNKMERFKEMYKNQFFVILITYAEVLPIGLVVAFVSSLILKNKKQ